MKKIQNKVWGALALALFVCLVVFLTYSLFRAPAASNIRSRPMNIILPKDFRLETLSSGPEPFMAPASSKPALVIFLASWCTVCPLQIPYLRALKAQGVPLYAVAYKDARPALKEWLKKHGIENLFSKVFLDQNGLAAIHLGVKAFPECFVVDEAGKIIHHLPGPLASMSVLKKVQDALKENK